MNFWQRLSTCELSIKQDLVADVKADFFSTFTGSVVETDGLARSTLQHFLFNKKLIHLIDDIFWQMGFHSSLKQEAVVPIESLLIIRIIGTI
jgi:hypothetical protein